MSDTTELELARAEAIEAGRKLFAGPCTFVAGAASIESLPPFGLPEIPCRHPIFPANSKSLAQASAKLSQERIRLPAL